MLQKWIDRGVAYCIGHSMLVIAAALLLAAMSAIYTARHFAIDTDINNLISERLPWRQSETAFQKAFPQAVELILVDVGAGSPEAAKAAAREVSQALAKRPDLFRAVRDQLDSPFFRRNGLLFLPPDQVAHAPALGTTTRNAAVSHEITLREQEVCDISLATFHVFGKEGTKAFRELLSSAGAAGRYSKSK